MKDAQKSPSPLIQCCTKFEKAMPGSGGQELPSKIVANIE